MLLTEMELDNLQWAKDFLNNYEKKHGKSYGNTIRRYLHEE